MIHLEPVSSAVTPSNRGVASNSFSSQLISIKQQPALHLRESFLNQKTDSVHTIAAEPNPQPNALFSMKPSTATSGSAGQFNRASLKGGAHVTYTFDFDLDENDASLEAEKRKQSLMFMQAKFIMKPLDSFLEGRQKIVPLSTQSSMLTNPAIPSSTNAAAPKKSIVISNGVSPALQLKSPMNQYAKNNPLGQLKAFRHSILQNENANSPTAIQDQQPSAFAPSTSTATPNGLVFPRPSLKSIVQSAGFQGTNSSNSNDASSQAQLNKSPTNQVVEEDSQEVQQLKQKNIFKEDIDLKSKSMTSMFDIGPRYDTNRKILNYSIVGKTEWFKKVESQKAAAAAKSNYPSMKANLAAQRRQSIQFSSFKDPQNNSGTAGTNALQQQDSNITQQQHASPPQQRSNQNQNQQTVPLSQSRLLTVASSQQRFNDNNNDNRSVASRSNIKRVKCGKLLGNNGDSDQNSVQTVTKDHLLMKFGEIESRIMKNTTREQEEKDQLKFPKKQESLKQERYLDRFKDQQAEWDKIAASLVDRSDKSMTLLGRGQLAQQAYAKYRNYTRVHAEDTLLVRSEDMMRAKKEQMQYIEHLKEPYEFIGSKNLWEGMLRNEDIDVTSKQTQEKKLFEYFFPKNIDRTLNSADHYNQLSTRKYRNSVHANTTIRNSEGMMSSSSSSSSNILGQHGGAKSARLFKSNSTARNRQADGGSENRNEECEGNDEVDVSNDEADVANAMREIKRKQDNNKIGFFFKRFDNGNREMSTSKGARIFTTKSNDLLEVVRTPKIDGSARHIAGVVGGAGAMATHGRKETETSEFNFSKGATLMSGNNIMSRTFNLSSSNSSQSFFDKNKTVVSDSKQLSIKQAYLNYFTSNEIDTMMVIGESKINAEKDTILNDGKQRFETYQLVIQKDATAKPDEGSSRKVITPMLARGGSKTVSGGGTTAANYNDNTLISNGPIISAVASGVPSPIKLLTSRPSNLQNISDIKVKRKQS